MIELFPSTLRGCCNGPVANRVRGEPLLQRVDLAHASDVHAMPGVTDEHGNVLLSAAERNLTTEKAFPVALTRIAHEANLATNNGGGDRQV